MIEIITLPYIVPYFAQVASPELATAIFIEGMDPVLDPRWAESGAETPQEYAWWVERACGVACLKMCVEALGGPVRSLVAWARLGQEQGGYLVRRGADGSLKEVGWVHGALARLARDCGLQAKAQPAGLEEITAELRLGRMLIASVSYEAGDERLAITHQGGHLMVVTGAELEHGQLRAFFVNNPSGRRSEWQAGARLAVERFAPAYSGRTIVIWR
jgi:hypothetical protein